MTVPRLLLVLAVGPAFALLLGLAGLSTRRLLLGGPGPVVRIAPVLYAGVVAGAALVAGVHTGFDPDELGLRSVPLLLADRPGASWWVTVTAICLGVAAGVAGYLLELLLADRALARRAGPRAAGDRRSGPQGAAGMRSVTAWAGTPWVLVVIGVVTAVSEEVLFRAYLLTGLRADLVLWAALGIQAVLFGTHHASFGARAVAAKTVHGLVWAVLAVAAGSLLPALAAHLTFQTLACRRVVRVDARARGSRFPKVGTVR